MWFKVHKLQLWNNFSAKDEMMVSILSICMGLQRRKKRYDEINLEKVSIVVSTWVESNNLHSDVSSRFSCVFKSNMLSVNWNKQQKKRDDKNFKL